MSLKMSPYLFSCTLIVFKGVLVSSFMKSMPGTTHNRTKKFVFNSFRCIVYLACYSVFSISLITILIKFNDGVTSTSTEIASQDKLKFPVLTFCPSVAFKNPGNFYKEEDFVSQVFTKEDLFGDETLQDFMNQSQFVYKETRSELLGNLMVILYIGRCCLSLISGI